MSTMQIATGILTAVTFTGTKIPTTAGDIMIVFICLFVAMFAASWGPLGWLVCLCSCSGYAGETVAPAHLYQVEKICLVRSSCTCDLES